MLYKSESLIYSTHVFVSTFHGPDAGCTTFRGMCCPVWEVNKPHAATCTNGGALRILVSWGCSLSLAPPLTSHLQLAPSQGGSKPALSSRLPQPSPHSAWLLCLLLTGRLQCLPSLSCHNDHTQTELTTPHFFARKALVSTKTHVRPLQIQPSPSCPNYLVCPLSSNKAGCHFRLGLTQLPSPKVLLPRC